MKTVLIFLAGMVSTVLIYAASSIPYIYRDWRWHRRYEKMWDKAQREFEKLDESQQAECKAKWAEQPWRYERWSCDRDRYFDMRWNSGHTTEV